MPLPVSPFCWTKPPERVSPPAPAGPARGQGNNFLTERGVDSRRLPYLGSFLRETITNARKNPTAKMKKKCWPNAKNPIGIPMKFGNW